MGKLTETRWNEEIEALRLARLPHLPTRPEDWSMGDQEAMSLTDPQVILRIPRVAES